MPSPTDTHAFCTHDRVHIAGTPGGPLAGLPQISLPLAAIDGLPIGLGLMAAPGCDEMLLAIAEDLGAVRT